MATANLIVLYVEDPAASARFYEKLLDTPPAMSSPNFVSFTAPGGAMIGLWRKSTAKPAPTGSGAASEVGFMLAGADAVADCYDRWKAAGVPIEQELTTLDFGPTFVANDPDGHRLRVCLFDE
jgi:predicted enzyme related to lactoylglutathione lyase